MYLLDTNVVSELRRARPHGGVLAWLAGIPARGLYMSAATLGELQRGVELTRDQNPEKATEIEAWIDTLEQNQNVLPIDGRVARTWARLMHQRSDTLLEDALIAATAIVHRFTVATRNVKDFRALGVATVDPFKAS